MKKIAIVMPTLLPMPPVKGGAVETLVDGLLKENERTGKFNITVFGIYDKDAAAASEQYTLTQFKMLRLNAGLTKCEGLASKVIRRLSGKRIGRGREYMAKVIPMLKKESWDAIIVQNNAYFSYRIARETKNAPVFAHIHNDVIDAEAAFLTGIIRRGAIIITVSKYIKNRVMTVPCADKDFVRVLPNCIDTERFGRGLYGSFRERFRKEHGIGDNDIVFIYTGRVIKEKGVLELARAFVGAGIPNAKLIIAGSKWFSTSGSDSYAASVFETLESVKHNVITTGYIPYSEIPAYYAAADVAVLPSLLDAAPLTVLEGMASGLPVITTDSGGIPETALPGRAIVVKKDDDLVSSLSCAMRKLADDSELRAALGESARRSMEDRNYTNYFKNFCEIIETPLTK